MIDVHAVGISRSLRNFQTLVGVLWVHRGRSVHIVFDVAEMFKRVIAVVILARSRKGIPE